jgi:hypothetical protein
MSEKRGNWLWNTLRGKKRDELDRIESTLVKRPGEERKFAGDPAQPEHLRIPLKKRPNWMK